MRKSNRRSKNKSAPSAAQKFILRLIAIIFSINLFASSIAAYVVDGGDGTAKVGMAVSLQTITAAIVSNYSKVMSFFDVQMAAMDAALAAAFKLENESIVSAMKVLTKQSSVSANMVAENIVKSAQTEAAFEQAEKQKQRIIDANENHGVAAQGYKVCTVLSQRKQVEKTVQNNKKSVPDLVSNTIYAQPGAYGNPYLVQQEMNSNHSAKYCTPEQAASGYCDRVTEEAGWDMQMSTLFTPTVEGSTVFDAQNALINNMVGLPDTAIPKSMQGTPMASRYLDAKQNKDALISPALYSLKSIQAEFAGISTTDSATKISPIRAIDEQVKRYLGSGKEYLEWNKVLVGASEPGVMKEILQIQALELYLKVRQYHQYEREEMLVAGNVAVAQKRLDMSNGGLMVGTITASDAQKSKIDARAIKSEFAKRQVLGNSATQ